MICSGFNYLKNKNLLYEFYKRLRFLKRNKETFRIAKSVDFELFRTVELKERDW